MLNLQQFRETRRIVDHDTASTSIGDELYDTLGAALYVDSCFIGLDEAGWILTLDRDEFRGSLDELEPRLYFEHYVQECVRDYDMEGLTALLDGYCRWQNLPLDVAANEMLCGALTVQQRRWTTWFIKIWEDLESLTPRWRVKLQLIGYDNRKAEPVLITVRSSSLTEAGEKAKAMCFPAQWIITDVLNIDELIKEYA